MTTNNAINLSQAGLANYDGAGVFTGVPVTQHDLILGAAANSLNSLPLTDGQIPIGNTGADPSAATLTAGPGINIANAGGAITISNTGAGFNWNDVTGGAATLAAENGYIADKSTLTTFTLPTNNAIGDTIKIMGKGTGGWTIVYGVLQHIVFGNVSTTSTTGTLSSSNQNDCVELICTTASITAPIFQVANVQGNLSYT